MAKAIVRRKKATQPVKPIITEGVKLPFSAPETFGDPWGSLNEISASIDFPARLSKNPLYSQDKNYLYQQINKGVMPFSIDGTSTYIDIKDIVELCQKAYFNVSIVRNTVDIMGEFSNSEIFFKGGNEKSRMFFKNWWRKIGGYSLADQWFRECYLSCNIILYRHDGDVDINILKKIGNIYGAEATGKLKLPVRYSLMNPANICTENGISFLNNIYYYKLGSYECMRVKNALKGTEEDRDFRNSLPVEIIKQIDNGVAPVLMPLNPEKIHATFYKKQDYFPFAVPMFFPVLSDIDLKLTFKGVEKILARTVEYVILLIKVGTPEEPNPLALEAFKELMRNETLGRVLVAGGDTEMEFIIPDINKVLGPEKYKQVNEDISHGLMDIFSSDEKFSSTSIKIKVFVERLNEARRTFLEMFLNPEIKRISQELGFKTYPTAEMANLDLNDKNLMDKLIVQMGQLGILTAEQVIECIQTGWLPTPEELLEGQEKYKAERAKGLYEPLVGGPKDAEGRPAGSKAPQTTKKISPTGISTGSQDVLEYYDINKIVENTKLSNEVYTELEKEVKAKYKIKKLNNNQKDIISSILPIIIANEKPEEWMSKVKEYVENPKSISNKVGFKLDEIQGKYDVSVFLSAILSHSIKED